MLDLTIKGRKKNENLIFDWIYLWWLYLSLVALSSHVYSMCYAFGPNEHTYIACLAGARRIIPGICALRVKHAYFMRRRCSYRPLFTFSMWIKLRPLINKMDKVLSFYKYQKEMENGRKKLVTYFEALKFELLMNI